MKTSKGDTDDEAVYCETKLSVFRKIQEEELLISLYNYQTYLVGLVIVCQYISRQLNEPVKFLQAFQSQLSPTISLDQTLVPGKVTSSSSQGKDKGPFSRVWEAWNPLGFICAGKKVGEFADLEVSVAFEVKEDT